MAAASNSLPATMKAWQFGNERGGLKNLRLNNAATPPKPPSPGTDGVLIEVISMSINPVDYKLPDFLWPVVTRLLIPKPASPGLDFCGRVVSLAEGLKDYPGHEPLKPGQLVFGRIDYPSDYPTQFGTLGQFITARRSGVAPLPDGVDVDHAAAIGTAALTAYQSLAPYVKEGAHVFINGGSGGVGTFTVQIAKILGCRVVVSCSAAKVELCKSLGADEVIDYTTCDVSETLKSSGHVFDLVVDNVSKPHDLYKAADHFLREKAHFVQATVDQDSLRGVLDLSSKLLLPSFLGGGRHPWHFVQVKNDLDALVQIGQWIKEDRLKVILDSTFEFENAPEAYQKLRTGRAKGKIVVRARKSRRSSRRMTFKLQ